MPRRSKRNGGFSLVEFLCAVAVAASAIAVLTSGVGGSIKGANKLDQHLGARLILQSILDDELATVVNGDDTHAVGPSQIGAALSRPKLGHAGHAVQHEIC